MPIISPILGTAPGRIRAICIGKAICTGLFTAKHQPNIMLTVLGATGFRYYLIEGRIEGHVAYIRYQAAART